MGKDKSWKLERNIGTEDKQLTTPEHDKLCMWVNDNRSKVLTSTKFGIKRYFELKEEGYEPEAKKVTLKWEEPIMNGKFVVGIPDFYYYVSFKVNKRDKHVEYWGSSIEGYIEVKPKIYSLGEVMRQVKLYKQYGKKNIVIVTSTPDYKDIFEEQGIDYVVHALD